MIIEFSTLLGVIGVVLTVLFFFIGYRQTIGARKERARAANKQAVDTLFRRLTLEKDFSIDLSGIDKFLSGTALEAKIKLSDMYSLKDFESSIFCRIVENDYLSEQLRFETIRRLEGFFKEFDNLSDIVQPIGRQVKMSAELALAVAAGITATVFSTFISLFSFDYFEKGISGISITAPSMDQISPIAVLIALVSITSAAMLLFVKARESSRSTDSDETSVNHLSTMFERSIQRAAERENKSMKTSPFAWADFIFNSNGKAIAVEVKYDINRLSRSATKSLIDRLSDLRKKDNIDLVLIVSATPVKSTLRSLENDNVKILQSSRFLTLIRSNDFSFS